MFIDLWALSTADFICIDIVTPFDSPHSHTINNNSPTSYPQHISQTMNEYDYDDDDEEYIIHQVQTANTMDKFGSYDLADVASSDKDIERRREQRIKRGECPNCRRKTHKVSRFPFGKSGKKRREPLTVEGEVDNGHCLRCNPIGNYPRGGAQPGLPAIPDTLYAYGNGDGDDMTVASEITMDPYLTADNNSSSREYRGGGGRYPHNRSHNRSVGSQFESVSEENEITEFGRHAQEVAGHISKLQDERREREREIVREHESPHLRGGRRHAAAGRRRISRQEQRRISEEVSEDLDTQESEESEDSEDDEEESEEQSWENHEQLIRDMEKQQKFHPLSKNTSNLSNNFSNSEPSIDVTAKSGDNEQSTSSGVAGRGRGVTLNGQKFHPLAKMAVFESERSMLSLGNSTTDKSTTSVKSSDSDRIYRLCQGSRSELIVEEGEKSPILDAAMMKMAAVPQATPPKMPQKQRKKGNFSEDNRFSLTRLSSGGNKSDDDKETLNRLLETNNNNSRRTVETITPRKKGAPNEPNRFSLTFLGDSLKTEDLDDSNRFSSLIQQQQKKKEDELATSSRKAKKTKPRNRASLDLEMNASKNWDSKDILRDAAAEANGEDLDAAVDALFRSVNSQQKPSDEYSNASETEDDESTDVNNMLMALSRFSSVNEEDAIATAITQRRESGMSSNSGAVQLSTIKDIPAIIQTVKSHPKDQKCIELAFQSLFLLATDPDPEGSLAREEILAKGGMETLVSAIWDHMKCSQVILALFHALWAFSAFNGNDDDDAGNDASISKIEECGVLEGLLFAMQSHSTDMSIQESGCDLITRMAGILPDDTPEFKAAVVLLSENVKVIEINTKAYSSCLDALNSLCQLSDGNKLAFAKAGTDCHNAIIRGLSSESPGLETRELACELFWCVTADRSAASELSKDGLLSKKIIVALKSVPRTKSSVHFYGAACGTLANLALDPDNHRKMIDLGVVQVLCEAIYVYDFSEDVNSAACTALANLSASRDIRNAIVSQGGTPALFSSMKSTSNNADIQSEVFRALNNLCESSSDGKQAIVADMEIIITTYFRHDGVKYIQQITCSILSRLSSDEKCRKSMIKVTQTFNALAKIMKANLSKKLVLKAACLALSNLSKEEEIIPIILSKGFSTLVIDAMYDNTDCEQLQEYACNFLMNISLASPAAYDDICSDGIKCIVKAMQTAPTSASLQQAICGALHATTKCDDHKDMALSAGAVDGIIYILLVHPNDINVLVNAVNVLGNLSSVKKGAKAIAEAGGISTVIEIMRSHSISSTDLILSGSRFIQNMALADREYANEATPSIAPMLECMKEHPSCAKLAEESCKALRCLVLKSESCRDKVLSSNGVAIIEKTRAENSNSQRWQMLLLDELFQE